MQRRTLLAWPVLTGLMATAEAVSPELRVVTSADPAPQRAIVQALKARFPAVRVLSTDADLAGPEARLAVWATVTLGPAALRRALAADLKGPVIALFTSSQQYRRISSEARRTSSAGGLTAIHAEASSQAQLQLVAALFQRRVTVGVLLSQESAYVERALREAAVATGLDLLIEQADPAADAVRSLNRLVGSQVLLAVPDATLYTADTLRFVLESTYRRGLPVVGFSPATVAAGTLACAYSSVDDIVADVAELLGGLGAAGHGPLPEPRFPRYWRVAVNDKVARSLGIVITDKVLGLGSAPTGKPR